MRPNRPVYLDNQATTPCDPRVVAAMLPFFTERFGNPHSAEHVMGRDAEDTVETARAAVAALVGAAPSEIVFTSGATESNNLAIKGAARHAKTQGSPRRRILTVATEHKCVLESVADLAAEDFEPVVLPVSPDGRVDPDAFGDAVDDRTLLVSVMAVNNETGVIQDIARLAERARAAGAIFHTDAAQAAGKIPIDVAGWDVDLLSLSAHKVYGPKGVGALYVRRRPRVRLAALLSGGGQERGVRSGTLPTPLIAGFGVAAALAHAELDADTARIGAERDRLWAGLRAAIPGVRRNGLAPHVAGALNVTFPHRSAQALMRAAPDLCVSTGSACSSAEIAPSTVLRAMGLSPDAAGRTLRLGLGRFTSAADVDFALAALIRAHTQAPVEA